jgi:holo-[acyl-carrier protein] synthase
MITGLGSDIIEIERIHHACEKHGQAFLDKHFTQKEQAYCQRYNNPYPHLAGRFAAKEAVLKALGTGVQPGLSWLDVEVINDSRGKPDIYLSPSVFEKVGPIHLLISISHCKAYAYAVAIAIESSMKSE